MTFYMIRNLNTGLYWRGSDCNKWHSQGMAFTDYEHLKSRFGTLVGQCHEKNLVIEKYEGVKID